jgi:hypothetical protein
LIPLTKSQRQRAVMALEETHRLLEKEQRYNLKHQNKKMINFYENHIQKLNKLLGA